MPTLPASTALPNVPARPAWQARSRRAPSPLPVATVPDALPLRSFKAAHTPAPWELRKLKQAQLRMEASFWDDHPDNDWVLRTEAVLNSPPYRRLLDWYLRRKPYFREGAVQEYGLLLTRHMKGKTITAHISIDPEDGWLSLWFTVYGLPRLRSPYAIHREHAAFLADLFDSGLHQRHTSGHIGLSIAPTPYRAPR